MKKAVSPVLIYEDYFYVGKRQDYLKAFPGFHAYPGGGKVEKNDFASDYLISKLPKIDSVDLGAMNRELKEEVGVSLEDLFKNGLVREITFLGRADAPPFNQVRFSSNFYAVILNKKVDLIFDKNEFLSAAWIRVSDIKKLWFERKIMMAPPTLKVVDYFLENKFNSKIQFGYEYRDDTIVHHIAPISGVKIFLPLSNTFPPASRTNCLLIGDNDDNRVLIDPSPKDEDEFNKLKKTLTLYNFSKILITHHHPDHHERATLLAKTFNCSLYMSEITHKLLIEKYGPNYLDGVEVNFISDGDIISHDQSVPLRCYHLPGHDSGMLGVAPDTFEWFFVSDLIQSIGTVVVGGKEGDMRKYFASLEKVIKCSPLFIIPSHGLPLGGVFQLQSTLKHRKMREEQIKELFHKGVSIDQMLEIIYSDIDQNLLKYARKTIEAHINKIQTD